MRIKNLTQIFVLGEVYGAIAAITSMAFAFDYAGHGWFWLSLFVLDFIFATKFYYKLERCKNGKNS